MIPRSCEPSRAIFQGTYLIISYMYSRLTFLLLIQSWQNKFALVCVNTTQKEEKVAKRLGVPLFAVRESLHKWGTKSGSRKVFAACSIPHALVSMRVLV